MVEDVTGHIEIRMHAIVSLVRPAEEISTVLHAGDDGGGIAVGGSVVGGVGEGGHFGAHVGEGGEAGGAVPGGRTKGCAVTPAKVGAEEPGVGGTGVVDAEGLRGESGIGAVVVGGLGVRPLGAAMEPLDWDICLAGGWWRTTRAWGVNVCSQE